MQEGSGRNALRFRSSRLARHFFSRSRVVYPDRKADARDAANRSELGVRGAHDGRRQKGGRSARALIREPEANHHGGS